MQADVDHLRLSIERQPDHWTTIVVDRFNGACLYRAQCTNLHCGQCVLLEFISCELGRRIRDEDLTWVEVRQEEPIIQRVSAT